MPTIQELENQVQTAKQQLETAQSAANNVNSLTATHAQLKQQLIEAKRQDALTEQKAEQADLLTEFETLANELNVHSEALIEGYATIKELGRQINTLNARICNAPRKICFFDMNLDLVPFSVFTGSVWQIDHLRNHRNKQIFQSRYTTFFEKINVLLKQWGS